MRKSKTDPKKLKVRYSQKESRFSGDEEYFSKGTSEYFEVTESDDSKDDEKNRIMVDDTL